jgi:hypothetical protein
MRVAGLSRRASGALSAPVNGTAAPMTQAKHLGLTM